MCRIEEAEAARRRTGEGASEDLGSSAYPKLCSELSLCSIDGCSFPCEHTWKMSSFELGTVESPRESSGCWRNTSRSEYHDPPGAAMHLFVMGNISNHWMFRISDGQGQKRCPSERCLAFPTSAAWSVLVCDVCVFFSIGGPLMLLQGLGLASSPWSRFDSEQPEVVPRWQLRGVGTTERCHDRWSCVHSLATTRW